MRLLVSIFVVALLAIIAWELAAIRDTMRSGVRIETTSLRPW